ncbi:heavy metal translocating P-type ATPase metal-binding domain-containing protein [Mucilaginibacter sp. AK015]|uniref:heavy metal translocating P-type ATPase n=1 Tax=Mucilaginibacter sp. AK015 TaxID=2723072 RepID=UPI001614157A|nr:heavy metal translocating P-type ATPase metal-binding domain-containing protein [Mucilaginibacter sp. AK015]
MAETHTLVNTLCYHCGDECQTTAYQKDDRQFCCQGCQSVYTILSGAGMCSYYHYNDHPGTTRTRVDKRFDYLSNPEVMAELLDYADERQQAITLYIPQIHCSSCLWLLEQLNRFNPAIHYSRVDFLKKQLIVRYDAEKFTLQQLVELLNDIGYEPLISLQDIIKKQNKASKGNLVQKIAVAGFCFGNVMLLSFPEYFGLSAFEQSFKYFFGWLNVLFSLPVVFYSGRGYFVSAWHNLKNKVLNIDFPLALGIAVLFLRTVVEVSTNSGAGFADTLCGLVFFLLVGKFVQQKTYHHISFERDYRSFFPVAVQVIAEGREKALPLSAIQTGHRIVIRHNEIIPADAILLKGEALIDFSFVTGEAVPVNKTLGEIIYAGGRQTGEAIELEVVKAVSQSYLTQLWNNEVFTRKQDNRMKTFSDRVSKYFTIVLIAVAMISLVAWLPFDYRRGIDAFTAVLIVACPCALALSTPFTMAAALSIFDRNLFYLKNTAVVEQLARIDTLVMDKTGTITTGSKSIELNGTLDPKHRRLIYSACANSIHPLSRMICQYFGYPEKGNVTDYCEIAGEGIRATVDGHRLLVGSSKLIFGQSQGEHLTTRVHLMVDGQYLGYFGFYHQYREGLKQVAELADSYTLYLLSGDQDQERSELLAYFLDNEHLFFAQSPQQKLDRIEILQQQGRQVMMLGDGLNDSGALMQSELGVAVTDDVNNFSPGSDAILDGRSFAKIPAFLRFSKDAVNIIHCSFLISLTYNLVGLSYAVSGNLSPLVAAVLMPLSTATIISFTTLATHFMAKRRNLL